MVSVFFNGFSSVFSSFRVLNLGGAFLFVQSLLGKTTLVDGRYFWKGLKPPTSKRFFIFVGCFFPSK